MSPPDSLGLRKRYRDLESDDVDVDEQHEDHLMDSAKSQFSKHQGKKKGKKSKNANKKKGKESPVSRQLTKDEEDLRQRRAARFQRAPQEKKSISTWNVSIFNVSVQEPSLLTKDIA